MEQEQILFVIRMRNQARAAARQFSGQLRQMGQRAREVAQRFQLIRRAGRALRATLAGVARGFAQVGAAARTAALGATLGNANTAATGLLGTMRSLAAIAVPFLAAGGLAASVNVIADFEQQMAAVRAISGATVEQFAALNEEARRLGATTVFTAREAGEGLEFLARAGFTAEEAVQSLESTLNLARVGMLDLGRSADIVSNIMSTFNLEAERTSQVSDVLAFVQARTNTNVEQLGEAFKFAGPVMAALGNDVNELAAAIGILGNTGIQASLAGTGIRIALLRLLNPTGEAADAIAALGLTLEDVNPEMNSLTEIVNTFAEAGLGAEEAAVLFGARGANAMLNLTRFNPDLQAFAEQTRDVAGFARRAADIMGDNLADAFRSLRSAAEEAILQLGEAGLAGAIRGLVDDVTNVIRLMTGFEAQVTGDIERIREITDAVKLFTVALGAAGLVKAAQLAVGALTALTGAVLRFTAALAVNPIFLIATAIAAAVSASVIFRNELIRVQGHVVQVGILAEEVWLAITTAAGLMGDEIRRVFDAISTAWDQHGDSIIDKAKTAANNAIGSFLALQDASRIIFRTIANLAVAAFDTVIERVGAIFDAAALAAEGEFSAAADTLAEGFANGFLDRAGDILDQSGEELAAIHGRRFGVDYVGNAIGAVSDGMDEAITPIVAGFDRLMDIVGERAAERTRQFLLENATALTESETRNQRQLAARRAVLSLDTDLSGLGGGGGGDTGDAGGPDQEAIDRMNDFRESFEQMIAQRRLEIDLIGESEDVRSREIELLRFRQQAAEAGLPDDEIRKMEQILASLIDINNERERENELLESRRDFQQDFQRELEDLRIEAALVGATNDERERALALVRLTREAQEAGFNPAEIEEFRRQMTAAWDAIAEAEEGAQTAAEGWAEAVRSAAEEFRNDFELMRDVGEAVFSELTDFINEALDSGELRFEDFAESVRKSLNRIASEQITGLIAQAILPSNGSGGFDIGSILGLVGAGAGAATGGAPGAGSARAGATAGGGSSFFGGIGSFLGSLFGDFGFQHGGQFTVGPGTGPTLPGVDNRLVTIRARDGEEVEVRPPGMAVAPQVSQSVRNNFTIVAPDPNAFRASERQVTRRIVLRSRQAFGAPGALR